MNNHLWIIRHMFMDILSKIVKTKDHMKDPPYTNSKFLILGIIFFFLSINLNTFYVLFQNVFSPGEKGHFLTNQFFTTCHLQLCFDYTIIFIFKNSTWMGWHLK